ncbi:ATP-binding protein [Paraburkholderia pallida]|uniref:ATP-binding protein n=2 Tax=Paraburkholderia pallida TaxID=2547399 RepID=A0A4P7D4U3_9BURK|nr:ATP-binding protein [Paraburkholderia pallida]
MCAGIELAPGFGALCAFAQGDPARDYPNFGLALAAFDDAHWSALAPSGPLRRWGLVEIRRGGPLTLAPLRIDEAFLHELTGVSELDTRIDGCVTPIDPPASLVATHAAVAREIAEVLAPDLARATQPLVLLTGDDRGGQQQVAACAFAQLGLLTFAFDAAVLGAPVDELEARARGWEREARLRGAALFVDAHELPDAAARLALGHFLERFATPVAVGARHPARYGRRALHVFDVERPLRAEQRELWRAALGGGLAPRERNNDGTSDGVNGGTRDGTSDGVNGGMRNGTSDGVTGAMRGGTSNDMSGSTSSGASSGMHDGLDAAIEPVAAQFDFDAATIETIARRAHAETGAPIGTRLWRAARAGGRNELAVLAQRLARRTAWSELVLPADQLDTLRDVLAHARHRGLVHDDWGIARGEERGLGLAALFHGPSGTGKTLAAEALGTALDLDVFRVDLSQLVSKYIGETEKNLCRVFDAAQASGAILLFDECDAIFGRRGEVERGQDRYANLEVSYLLQRMESYRGISILTTNLRNAIDPAFMRRLRFVVSFPFPDYAQRMEIWQRLFANGVPVQDIDFAQLARLNVAGGSIRNIVIYAAFLAADAGSAVSMRHLRRAALAECAKLERRPSEVEIGGWA